MNNNTTAAQVGIHAILDKMESESDLVGYALNESAVHLGNAWIDELSKGGKRDLISDVDALIRRLDKFKAAARLVLPIENGGLA